MAETIMTSVEAMVSAVNWDLLIRNYLSMLDELRDVIHNSFLVENTENQSSWRIETVWRSREDFERINNSGGIPAEVVFRTANTEPIVSIWTVVEKY